MSMDCQCEGKVEREIERKKSSKARDGKRVKKASAPTIFSPTLATLTLYHWLRKAPAECQKLDWPADRRAVQPDPYLLQGRTV